MRRRWQHMHPFDGIYWESCWRSPTVNINTFTRKKEKSAEGNDLNEGEYECLGPTTYQGMTKGYQNYSYLVPEVHKPLISRIQVFQVLFKNDCLISPGEIKSHKKAYQEQKLQLINDEEEYKS
jgi:hypothetical protein